MRTSTDSVRPLAALLIAAVVLLCGCAGSRTGGQAAVAPAPAAAAAETVPFGPGALKGLKAGTGYVYRLLVDKGYRSPTARATESGTATHYVRVLVTAVEERGGAVEVKGRLDELDNYGKLLHGDLYPFTLSAREDGSDATLTMASSAGGADALGLAEGIPFFLLEYPNFGSVPRDKPAEPVVRNKTAGAMVVRFTPTYDARVGRLEVSVERFRYAGEDDAAKGRRVLYWVKDAQQLTPTVPEGQDAAPLYAPAGGPTRDKGDLEKYSVRPVVANGWETQVWEPGAPFPKEVRFSAPESGGGYSARLLVVQHLVPGAVPARRFMEQGLAGNGEGRGWADG